MAISFSFILIATGIFYSIFYLVFGVISSPAIFTFCILTLVCTLFFLRRSGNLYLAANIITGTFLFALYPTTFFFGGHNSPALMWLIAVPLVAIPLTGKRTGIIWTVLTLSALLSFFLLDMAGFTFKNELPPQYLKIVKSCLLIGLFLFISISFLMNEIYKNHMIDLHRKANEKVVEREQMLNTILAASPAGICMLQDRKILWGNAAITRMLGWNPEEYEGKDTRLFYAHEKEYQRVGEHLYKERRGEILRETDAKLIRKNGESVDCIISILFIDPLHPEKGDILALTDITERKLAEDALRESEEKYRLIMETVPNAITIARLNDYRFIHVNECFCKMTGYTREEALGKTALELNLLFSEDDYIQLNERIEDSGQIDDLEIKYEQKDGKNIDVLISAKLLHYLNEFLIVTVASDITGRKQAEHEITLLNKQLENKILDRTEKLKDAHQEIIQKEHKSELADITTGTLHNVKNILTSVKISSDTISELQSKGSINSLRKANGLLKEQIDNIEDFICNDSKGKKLMQYFLKLGESFDQEEIESFKHIKRLNEKVDAIEKIVTAQQGYGGREDTEPVKLKTIIEDALIMQANSIEAFNLKIEKDFSDNSEVIVLKTKLMHILINLIKNAKEAMIETPSDMRKLIISTEQAETGIYLKISDTGCGIPNENLSSMFRHGFTTKKDGHGFGLASCAAYMKEMNGAMTVESEGEGKGSTFILSFPIS